MNGSLQNVVVRVLMVVSWVMIIFAFLYVPYLSRFVYQPKSINLFIWPMILDAKVLAQFEQETGIKVYVNYYESNEELYSKFQATGGKGYDIIVPTDYMVETLIQDGLLKKIDKSKLTFLDELQPFLLGKYFDPTNDYSIPYYSAVFGLGINKDLFGQDLSQISWSLIFDEKKAPHSLSMLDSPREALLLGAFYLFGSIDNLDEPDRLKAIENLLIKQKQWTYVYTSFRVEELLASGSCPIAVGTNTDVWKAQREYPHITFMVPQEGSFATIDSFVIPKATDKDEQIYALINFLFRTDILQHNVHKHGFCPPTSTVKLYDKDIFCPNAEQFKRFDFFRNVLTRQQMQDMWISVKSH